MRDDIEQKIEGVIQLYNKHKKACVVFGAAILVLTAIVGTNFSPKKYGVLVSKTSSDRLALIIKQLNKKKIPYKLDHKSQAVMVPEELLSSVQKTIISEIENSSSNENMGLEVFDKSSFATSSYVHRVNYQRALQGELMRSINSLDAVKRSKVILALPAKKTFLLDKSQEPSASIVLELHSGKRLSKSQANGIRFLVSSAVQGLSVEKVTVVDARGRMLTGRVHLPKKNQWDSWSPQTPPLKNPEKAAIEKKDLAITKNGKKLVDSNKKTPPLQETLQEKKLWKFDYLSAKAISRSPFLWVWIFLGFTALFFLVTKFFIRKRAYIHSQNIYNSMLTKTVEEVEESGVIEGLNGSPALNQNNDSSGTNIFNQPLNKIPQEKEFAQFSLDKNLHIQDLRQKILNTMEGDKEKAKEAFHSWCCESKEKHN